MKYNIKSKLFGTVLSDGSVVVSPSCTFQHSLTIKSVDVINHSVWTGNRPKKQTEISSFIERFDIKIKR